MAVPASLSWPPGPAVNLSRSILLLTGLWTDAVSRGPAGEGRAWASTQKSSSGRRSHVGREGTPGLRGEPHGDRGWGTRIQGAPLQPGVCPGRPGSTSRCVCASVPCSVHWAPGQGLCCPWGARKPYLVTQCVPSRGRDSQSSEGEGLPPPPPSLARRPPCHLCRSAPGWGDGAISASVWIKPPPSADPRSCGDGDVISSD